jgi:hypothetical protein
VNITFPNGYQQQTGDREMMEALQRMVRQDGHSGNINPYLNAGWRIRDGLPLAISIDNFLEAHAGDEQVELMGKLAIARAILTAEASSPLMINENQRQIDTSTIAATWYGGFMRALTEGVPRDALASLFDNVTIITFNYDRSLEQFLAHGLAAYYQVPLENTQQLVGGARIFHPYGMVGQLPWQSQSHNGGMRFGGGAGFQLIPVAQQIKTFGESIGGEVPIDLIHESMNSADQIVFLGFAYHRQNLQLITPAERRRKHRRLYGTSFGVSESDLEVIGADLKNMFWQEATGSAHTTLQFAPMTCKAFMEAYHRTITN